MNKICMTCGGAYSRRYRQSAKSWDASKTCSLSCASRSRKTLPLADRFWRLVDKRGPTQPHMESECWLWTGSATREGYGQIGVGGSGNTRRATHVALELAGVAIAPGQCACHRCDNPQCVRADHLFVGTKKDNVRDAIAKGRMGFQRYPEMYRAQPWREPQPKAPPKPCAECGRLAKPLRRGRCHACYERLRNRLAFVTTRSALGANR